MFHSALHASVRLCCLSGM